MAKGYDKPPVTRFAKALRAFARQHHGREDGAQAWLVEKTKIPFPMISRWWTGAAPGGQGLPGDVAFEKFIASFSHDGPGKLALREAWEQDRADLAQERRSRRLSGRRAQDDERPLVMRDSPPEGVSRELYGIAANALHDVLNDLKEPEVRAAVAFLREVRRLGWQAVRGVLELALAGVAAGRAGRARSRRYEDDDAVVMANPGRGSPVWDPARDDMGAAVDATLGSVPLKTLSERMNDADAAFAEDAINEAARIALEVLDRLMSLVAAAHRPKAETTKATLIEGANGKGSAGGIAKALAVVRTLMNQRQAPPPSESGRLGRPVVPDEGNGDGPKT